MRWRRDKVNAAINLMNEVYLPLTRILHRLRSNGVKHEWVVSEDRRVVVLNVYWPSGRPWTLGFYVTTQEARALSPRDVSVKLARLRRFVARHAPPPPRDTTLAIVADGKRTKTTVGARRVLAENRVKLMTPQEILDLINSYFSQRLARLRQVMRDLASLGKKIPQGLRVLEVVFEYIVSKLTIGLNMDLL